MKRRRIWLKLAGALVVLLLLVRFVGVALVPSVLDSMLEDSGLTCEIDDLDVSVFAGEIRLRGLVVRERDGDAQRLLDLHHVAVDLDMSSTLLGDPACHRAEIDGVFIDLVRADERGWNFARLTASSAEADSEPAKAIETVEPNFDLRSPIRIASLRLQDVHVRVRDELSEPRIESELTLNMTASKIGDEEMPGQFELIADAREVLDFMRVEGSLESGEASAAASATFEMRGAHLKPLKAWLEVAGLEALCESLDASGSVSLSATVSGAESETLTATIATENWVLADDQEPALELDRSEHVIELAPLAVRRSELTGMRARTRKESTGAFSVAGLAVVGSPPASEPVVAKETKSSEPFGWSVDSFRISEASLTHVDARTETDVELRLDSFEAADLDSVGAKRATFGLRASAPGDFESFTASGEFVPGMESSALTASFDLVGCTVERCRAILARAGIEPQLSDATAHGELVATIQRDGTGGAIELRELRFDSGKSETALSKLSAEVLDLTDQVHIGEVRMSGLRGSLERHADGSLELAGFVLRPTDPVGDNSSPEATTTQSQPSASSPTLRLDHFTWTDTQLEFVDHAQPNLSLATSAFEFDVTNFAFGAKSECEVNARIDLDGWCEQITVDGTFSSEKLGDFDGGLHLHVLGLDGERLASVLPPDAVPSFTRGQFETRLGLNVEETGNGLRSSLQLSDLALTLDESPLASLALLSIDELQPSVDGVRIGGVRLEGVELSHRDSIVALDANMAALQLGSSEPVEFSASVALRDEPPTLEIGGSFIPDPNDLSVDASLRASGIRGSSLDRFMTAGASCALVDGVFGVDLSAQLKSLNEGGLSGALTLANASITEASLGGSLFEFDRIELAASRIDAESGYFEIGKVHVLGLGLDITREPDGSLRFAGFELRAAEPKGADEPGLPESAGKVKAVEASWARAYDTEPLPTVLLNSLKLELSSIRFQDRSAPESVPVILAANFGHEGELVVMSPEVDSLVPLEFTFESSARPIVDSTRVSITLAPWEEEARVRVEVVGTGVHGSAIADVLPGLATQIDANNLVDGEFGAALEARVVTRRRNPLDFDLRSGLGFEVSIQDLFMRNDGEEAPLASLGSLDVEVERFDPATGAVKIASVDIADLQGRARLLESGPEILGCVLLARPESEPPLETETDLESAEPYAGPEIELARLSVNGLDFVVQDERTSPATILPLNALGIDVERFSTKTFTERSPFRFGFYLGAGEVELPKRKGPQSLLAGLADAAKLAVGADEEAAKYEQRPAFGEISASGNLSLGPKPSGRVKASIDSFELLSLAGIARDAGVDIGDGTLDTWVRVKLEGEDGVAVRSKVSFTDLSLSEPEDGIISQFLKLPTSLDSVLFALKNNDDEHHIPLKFRVSADGIGGGEIASVAVSVLGKVIASALASAPLRVGDGVSDMLAIPGMDESPVGWVAGLFRPILVRVGLAERGGPESEPVSVEYAGGAHSLNEAAIRSLESLVDELESREDLSVLIVHEYGADDAPRARELANPSMDECGHIAAGLRRRKRELAKRRSECAADLAAEFAVGGAEKAATLRDELRAIEAELGRVELALDETLSRLRPGGERYEAKRTRNALREIAGTRIAELEALFENVLGEGASERITIKRPRLNATSGAASSRVRVSLQKIEGE